jgi:DNA repair ATPase RecN
VVTKNQSFVDCSEKAIDARDESIKTARNLYNKEMEKAMIIRKDSEKKILLIENDADKKVALRKAVEEYKRTVTENQGNLKESRELIWAAFDKTIEQCRTQRKNAQKSEVSIKKQVEQKSISQEGRAEEKESRGASLINSIKQTFGATRGH